MKLKKLMKSLLLSTGIAAILSTYSCQKYGLETYASNINETLNPKEAIKKKIHSETINLSQADALIVANMFSESQTQTKSSGKRAIKDVKTINNKNGNPLIYAVNYEDGYVLVSATKKCFPVLAFVDHGYFSLNSEFGQDVLLQEYIEEIDYVLQDSTISKKCYSWLPYEEASTTENADTKVGIDDEYYNLLETYTAQWINDGCNVYLLKNKPENMPDDLYQLFYNIAYDDLGDHPVYPYTDCAIITEKYFDEDNSIPPRLQTNWNQYSPYNTALSNPELPLGCVTIATGQIMRYHEFPANYNWDLMPNSSSNTTLSNFLRELHDDLGVNNNGGASIYDADRVFGQYGYTHKIIQHSSTAVYSSLRSGNPVYMRGIDNNTNTGHAWVCDGVYYKTESVEYKLYEIVLANNVPYSFDEFARETIYSPNSISYHMNWGWGGLNNGYFIDGTFYVPIDGVKYNFVKNRKDLIISK